MTLPVLLVLHTVATAAAQGGPGITRPPTVAGTQSAPDAGSKKTQKNKNPIDSDAPVNLHLGLGVVAAGPRLALRRGYWLLPGRDGPAAPNW